uniref:Conserved oligomeric Golgi complex subunit 6 n=1 Tax=Peronospora matthiolae TaxID=2874970 RepID=A0AAV1V4K4_9STRA
MTTPALQARVHKLLGSRTELKATTSLLCTLVKDDGTSLVQLDTSVNPETSSLATLRRTLRSSLEMEQLSIAQKALDGYKRTLEHVSNLATQVNELDAKCARIVDFLAMTKKETQQVQSEATVVAKNRDKVHEQWRHVKVFLDQYHLTEDEVSTLYAEELTDNDMDTFVSTMERVRQVKADCKELVATDKIHCGLELLDAISKYQDAGFKRLYQWTVNSCADVDGEPSTMLHRAIALLRDRAEFYNYCKESFVTSRRSLLVRRFITALTVGGPHGIPRPIEMHAHDPVRYCGDMLAWVHQSIATENEFFRVIFDNDTDFSPLAATDLSLAHSEAVDGVSPDHHLSTTDKSQKHANSAAEDGCSSMVGRAFDDVSRPLQVRIEQTLGSPHGMIVAYKLVHLLAFYHYKFDQLIAHADVARALRHCREVANEAFRRQFQQLVDGVAASPQDYSTNLAASHAVLDVSRRLVALLEVFQTSLLPEQEKEADLAPLFDKVLAAVELVSQRSVASLDPVEALVFRINNFSCLQAPLARFPEVMRWYLKTGQDVDGWLRNLSELQASSVMDRCRGSTLVQHIHEFQQSCGATEMKTGILPADAPGLDGETISRVMRDFCAVLMTLTFPQLESLAQPVLSDKAHALTRATLASKYKLIYEFVRDAKNGYAVSDEPTSSTSLSGSSVKRSQCVVLPHTPEEICNVLEIDEGTK